MHYAHGLVKTESEGIEATVRRGAPTEEGDVGYMAVRKGYSLGQEKDWTGCVEQDLREFGIKSEG